MKHIFQVTVLVDADEEFSYLQYQEIQKVLDAGVDWMLKEIDTYSDGVQECLNGDLLGMEVSK